MVRTIRAGVVTPTPVGPQTYRVLEHTVPTDYVLCIYTRRRTNDVIFINILVYMCAQLNYVQNVYVGCFIF